MSEPKAPLLCDLSWDKLSPGFLRYKLGPVELINRGILYNGGAKVCIPRGQCEIVMRNLMLYFPGFCSCSMLIERLYSNPDIEPDYADTIVRDRITTLRPRIPRFGLRLITKYKVGYKIEFIPGWEEL